MFQFRCEYWCIILKAESNADAIHPDLQWIRTVIMDIGGDRIAFIAVFGSHARATAHALSDIDIAIKTTLSESEERWQLLLELVSALNGPKRWVDVVLIENVNWSLRYRIARDGKVLFAREGTWERFLADVMIYYPDYAIFEQRFLEQAMRSIRDGN